MGPRTMLHLILALAGGPVAPVGAQPPVPPLPDLRASGGYGFGARVAALLGPDATPEVVDLVRNTMRATNPRGFMQGIKLGLADGYAPDEVAAKVPVPVLLLTGSEDRVNPAATNAAVLQRVLSNARLEIVERVGHVPHLEAPARVNHRLREFFGH